eukprot:scaffold569482_cov15-Prasinocladus_malaysianus.AAC.1
MADQLSYPYSYLWARIFVIQRALLDGDTTTSSTEVHVRIRILRGSYIRVRLSTGLWTPPWLSGLV